MQHYKSVNNPVENTTNTYHHNNSNGHSEHSPNSSHLSVHSEDALLSRTHHKQQTTQQVTTVTKVVREVKHLGPDSQQMDYVAMPLDIQHLGPEGQPVDYVAMPLGIYPRSQYINYNHIDHSHGHGQHPHAAAQQHAMYVHGGGVGSGGSVGTMADPSQYHSQHPHYADYEHSYGSSGQYANSSSYMGAGGGGGVGAVYLNDYGVNERTGGTSPSPSDEHSGSQSPQLQHGVIVSMATGVHQQQQQQQHIGVPPPQPPSVAYLHQAPYDEMADYRITPSPGGPVDNYPDDPTTMVYGYVSTSPYGNTVSGGSGGVVASNAAGNPTYASRPIVYEDGLNGAAGAIVTVGSGNGNTIVSGGSGGVGSIGGIITGAGHLSGRLLFENEEELQKHMANLSIHGHGVGGGGSGVGILGGHGMTTSPGSIIGGGGGGGGIPTDDEQQRAMRWRDPNLTEVISFLNNPNNIIKANAAAYLQHLCYMDDPNKQRTRTLGGIPPLVKLLSHESPDVYRNACGALRNLSYGRQNDENKRAIKNANGIIALINLLRRTTESEVKELVTGVIWNMSSCEDLKRAIIDDAVSVIVTYIIIPHSGWDPNSPGDTCWSNVFRNASGVLRNVSSAGEYARTKLRDCDGLVDSLLYVVRSAIEKTSIGNKIVENCVCILRNLSYRCQEVEDPNYDKHPLPIQSRVTAATSSKGENLGCFGASKKKKDSQQSEQKDNLSGNGNSGGGSGGGGSGGSIVGSSGSGNGGLSGTSSGGGGGSGNGTTSRSSIQRQEPFKGYELLWQPDVVQSYLALLQSCSNPETLEAAAGALQNLAACYWQPSIEIRAAVRKEKGLPILVELLRMEVDRVVCAVATALRNLAIDQRNKELIGKYAMRDLVQKLPTGNPQHDQGTSDDTIAAVLATLNEVIKKNAEFSRSLLDAGGVERLMNITRQRQKYTPRVLKFAGQVLFTMWQHQELRDVYKKHGWKEQDFVTKTVAARNAAPNSPNNANSTLNRPMASQGGTRYEDRTMKRQTTGTGTGAGGVGGGASATISPGGGSSGNHTLLTSGNRGGSGGGNSGASNMSAVGSTGVNMVVPSSGSGSLYQRNDDIPMADMAYAETNHQQQMRLYASSAAMTGNGPIQSSTNFVKYNEVVNSRRNGEPLYAKINRQQKKRTRTTATINAFASNYDNIDDDEDEYDDNNH